MINVKNPPDCPDCRIPMEPIENTIWKGDQEKDTDNIIFRCRNCNFQTKIPKECVIIIERM